MSSSRLRRKSHPGKSLSQTIVENRTNDRISLSQSTASTSGRNFEAVPESCLDRTLSSCESRLANAVIKYLFTLDREKQVVTKTQLIKNVVGNGGKHFHEVMNRAKVVLSEVFGYHLIEFEGNKYLLANKLANELPHICPSGMEASRQVILFLVLTHIFMQGECCSEESLWEFLTTLGISSADNFSHPYFGNVKHLITEVFVSQRYLDKCVSENSDPPRVEFRWGIRAEHEFSRRAALNFVSQVYNGRAINSWPLQFKALTTREGKGRGRGRAC